MAFLHLYNVFCAIINSEDLHLSLVLLKSAQNQKNLVKITAVLVKITAVLIKIKVMKMGKKGDFENPKVQRRNFSTNSVPVQFFS